MKLDKLTSIRLFKGDNDQLQKIADAKGLDRSDVLREAVKIYLQGEKEHPFGSI